MEQRGKAYTRRMRAKHIAKKKRTDLSVRPYLAKYGGWYGGVDGKYSKGKIHCSCPLCTSKGLYGHLPSMQELRHPDTSKKDMVEMEEIKREMQSVCCYKDCEKGREKYNELNAKCDSVFDLAFDFHEFVEECCKTCDKYKEKETE